MRSITSPKLAGADRARPGEGARRRPPPPATRARRAMIALEGTQPTLRQSPPIRWRSTSATRAPSPAAMAAVTSPAGARADDDQVIAVPRRADSTQSGGCTLATSCG